MSHVNEKELLKKAAAEKNTVKADKPEKTKAAKAEKVAKPKKEITVATLTDLAKLPAGAVLEVSGHEGEGRRAPAVVFKVSNGVVYCEHSKNLLILKTQKDVDTWKVSITQERGATPNFKPDRVKNHFRAHPESLRDTVLMSIAKMADIIEVVKAEKSHAKG